MFLATEPERQLKLTLLWDRADLAENKILSNNGPVWTVRNFVSGLKHFCRE